MCSRALLLSGKLKQWNLHVNCHVNRTTFQSGLRFQNGLSSLRVSCKRALNVYMENSLRFEISLRSLDRSEFHSAEDMWTLIIKLPHTEVKFYPEVKSQTGLSYEKVSLGTRLHETQRELKPVWNPKPLWNDVPFTW